MDFDQMSKDDLINYIKSLNEEKSGKLGLIWDREKVPEDIVLECNKKIPVLKNISEKNIITSNNKCNNNNLLIEGDNFHSLSVLSYTHNESIDVIYIDPPYNTGSEDFVYNDKYVNSEDGYRHSKWLNFMDKRLKIARRLLKQDGVIFISIDDNEYAQLKLLCDEIFGENNLLSIHHMQVRYDNKSLNEDNDWQPVMEYVLIYAKRKNLFKANKRCEEYDLSKFQYKITELTKGTTLKIGNKTVTIFKDGEWKIEKGKGKIGLLKETWASGSIVRQSGTAAEFLSKYLIKRKDQDGLNVLYKIHNMGEDGLGYRYVTGPKRHDAIRGKFYSGVPLERIKEIENNGFSKKTRPISNYYDFSADFGNIRNEGGIPFNNGKKPIKMLKELINYHPNKNALVLDFFAGSGSTGHAVLELNKEDGGERRFILCTNNEISLKDEKEFKKKNNINDETLIEYKKKNNKKWLKFIEEKGICNSITYPRINNVINGYKNKKGLVGNLLYFKTEFVEVNGSKDQLYYDLTEKCIPMLCIKENTHVLVRKDNEYCIYSNEEKTKYTCVYFDAFGNNYNKFINDIENIYEFKALYIFTLGNEINQNELVDVHNYEVEPIPYKILELYNKIIDLSREI
ncbi:MAG: site-specific DNA-methyltransferase [Bacilli bacterium]